MRKRSITALILALGFLTGFALLAYAAFDRIETRYYNFAGTGDINIRIDVYQWDNEKNEAVWIDGNDYEPTSAPDENDENTEPKQPGDGEPMENADKPQAADENEDNNSENTDDDNENENGESENYVTWNGQKVLPGQTVSYITKITNLAESAWIRIAPQYLSETNIDWFSDANLIIAKAGESDNENTGNWEKHEDYYYYTEPVDTGDDITFTTAFRVPSDLTNDTIPTQGFQIYLNADAVQSKHFTPIPSEDGETIFGDDPWFGTVIEECYHIADSDEHYTDGTYNVGATETNTFSVKFEDFSAGFVEIDQDFFSNWAKLMPGDEEKGEVTVGNNYDSPVTIYFHIERVDENDAFYDRELLTALQIDIRSITDDGDDGEVIYSGPLYGTTEPVALGLYQKGDTTKLKYTLSFDKEYQNKYTLRDTETIWVFSTDITDSNYELPSIGGIGTTIYWVAGTALILISFVSMIILKKKGGAGA